MYEKKCVDMEQREKKIVEERETIFRRGSKEKGKGERPR
jgi:hypothetical protein